MWDPVGRGQLASRESGCEYKSRPFRRHAADELYGIALAAALDADVTLMKGSQPHDVLEADLYGRLVRDVGVNGTQVIADLAWPPLQAALQGGFDLLKLSSEELVDERLADGHELSDIVAGARRLQLTGARRVLIRSRRPDPSGS